jgi:glycosyltransferase involved in cell wall biosynthesis
LHSALDQTYDDSEIIVIDDGSTDDTRERVRRYGEEVRYYYQSNKGVSAARNTGLSVATGELIAYLDADDIWYPHKLSSQVSFLDDNQHCGFVHSEVDIIDENDEIIHRKMNQTTGRSVPRGYCTLQLLKRNHIHDSTVLVRRKYVDRVGHFDERLKAVEDYLQWILISMEGAAVGYMDEPVAMYRVTKGSLSSSRRRMLENFLKLFEILLEEKSLGQRCGLDAVKIVLDRLITVRSELAYLYRTEGQTDDAMRLLLGLIRDRPLQAGLYVELLKTRIPLTLMTKIRIARQALRMRIEVRTPG